MSNITKSQIKTLVVKGKTKSALEIIYHISERVDADIHKLACLNLYRYNNHIDDDLAGTAKSETPTIISKNTLELIDRLPDNNFENPLPKLTKEILNEQKFVLKNINLRRLLVLLSLLLIGSITWFFYPKDPLKIVGKWHYKVTSKNNERLLGIKDVNKPLEPLYDSICGHVTIEPIQFNQSNYNMTGVRSEKFIDGIDKLEKDIDLKFTELSYDDNINNKYYFFRFEAMGDEKNKGFVRINYLPIKNGKLNKMSGEIFYLYNHDEIQQWKTVDISFDREE